MTSTSTTRDRDELYGTKLANGRYVLGTLLGGGGMGSVYLGRDRQEKRRVAIKVLHKEILDTPTIRERFEREAEAMRRLKHRNTVNFIESGVDGDLHYIVMELLEGPPLHHVIHKRGRLLTHEVVDISTQIADALASAHELGILHRDIKPDNIVLTDAKEDEEFGTMVKVCDFGVAKVLRGKTDDKDSWGRAPSLTGYNQLWGTPEFMSPEQARGGVLDGRSDVYALGVLMYNMATGVVPFDGHSPVAIAMAHIDQIPLPPSQHEPSITMELEAVILKCMAKSPDDRYPTARELQQALAAIPRDDDFDSLLMHITDLTDAVDEFGQTGEWDLPENMPAQAEQLPVSTATPPPFAVLRPRAGRGKRGDTSSRNQESSPGLEATKRDTPLPPAVDVADVAPIASPDTPAGRSPAVDSPLEPASGLQRPAKPRRAKPLVAKTQLMEVDKRPAHPSKTQWVRVVGYLLLLVLVASVSWFVSRSTDKPAKPNLNTYTFASEPVGAELFVDEQTVGVTPLAIDIPSNEGRVVELRLAGYGSWRDRIPAGSVPRHFDVRLVPAREYGTVLVTTTPPGATLTIGKRSATTPGALGELWVGDVHRATITLRGYKPVVENVVFNDTYLVNLTIPLQPATTGFIGAECPDVPCVVLIDGKKVGVTPLAPFASVSDTPAVVALQRGGKVIRTETVEPAIGEFVVVSPSGASSASAAP